MVAAFNKARKLFTKGTITRPKKFSQTFAETWVYETKPFSAVFVITLEGMGCACPVMVHAGTGSPILGTYATGVVIIKLKMIANPCEVIAEAGMRWKYILLTGQSANG